LQGTTEAKMSLPIIMPISFYVEHKQAVYVMIIAPIIIIIIIFLLSIPYFKCFRPILKVVCKYSNKKR